MNLDLLTNSILNVSLLTYSFMEKIILLEICLVNNALTLTYYILLSQSPFKYKQTIRYGNLKQYTEISMLIRYANSFKARFGRIVQK